MPTPTTISPLQQFKMAFPDTFRLFEDDDELRYKFGSKLLAEICEAEALKIIVRERLPLAAHVEVWTSRRVVREIALVIRPVPEEYDIADEVPGECIDPDWWGQPRERE